MPKLTIGHDRQRRHRRSQLSIEPLEARQLLDAGGLLAHWTFDDAHVDGNTITDTGNHASGPFDGTKTNSGPVTGIAGVIGEAAQFEGGPSNGDHPFVDLAAHAGDFGALGQGTIAAWVQPSTADLSTDVLTIMAVSNGSAASEEMRFWVSNGFPFGTGTLAYGVRSGSTNGTITSSTSNLLDGQWHHVAVTVTSDHTAQLFIDGQPDGSGAVSFLTDLDADAAAIGRNRDSTAGGGQWFYDGNMDDVGLWQQPLSAAKIRALVELAEHPTLNYDQGTAADVFQVFDDAFGTTTVGNLNWNYVPSGLTGAEGEVVDDGGNAFSINLGGGAGLRTGVAPLVVIATDPEDGAVLTTAPTTFTVDFSENYDAASLDASDLQINGMSALGASVVDSDSVSFAVTGLSQSRVNTIQMAADALTTQAGGGLLEYNGQFTIPDAPSIATLPAFEIGAFLATVRGEILDTGGDLPAIDIYWGTSDGGVDLAAWDQVLSLDGIFDAGEFATALTGLTPTTTYFYRLRASNLGGTTWAATTESFATTAAPQLVITEFMADNERTLDDEDGDSSDWIEIHNPNLFPVDLLGWYLTDRQSDLTRWQFPSEVIGPNEHVIVFASNKDRAVAGSQLHTSFALSAGGEYLALVQPDGMTIASEFGLDGTDYPEQYADISHGLPQDQTVLPLIGEKADAKFTVPTGPALEATWTARTFDDSAWTDVTTAVGYDVGAQAPGLIAYWDFDAAAGPGAIVPDVSNASHDGVLVGDAFTADGALNLDGNGDYVDVGDQSTLEGLSRFSVAAWVRTDIAVTSLRRIVEHEDVFYFWAEDGQFRFTTHGSSGHVIGTSGVPVGEWTHVAATFSGILGQIYVNGERESVRILSSMPTSSFPLQIGARRSGGGAASNFWDGSLDDVAIWDRALGAEEIALLASGDPPDGIGSLEKSIETDIGPQMAETNATGYLRVPFEVTDPAALDVLTLDISYDDGFVAYVNGQIVAFRNAPDPATWSSKATMGLGDLGTDSIDISPAISSLVAGQNTLAIQLLNATPSDSDVFIDPRLTAIDIAELDPSIQEFFDQPTPGTINGSGYATVTTDVVTMSQPSGTFTTAFDVELTAEAPEAAIHYTLDGAPPSMDSPLYAGPITVDSTTQVRARVIASDSVPGPIRSESYVRLAADVADFSSPLPIIVLENFGDGAVPNKRAANSPAGDGSGIFQVERQMNYMAIFESADRATLDVAPSLSTRSGIRVRGASSANFNKQSYSLETWGEVDDDENRRPFGLPAESDWVLYGPSSEFDWSFIHNSFIYEISQQTDNYAPRFQFVELFLNTGGGDLSLADHQGLYIFMEKIKDDGDRVDIENLTADGTDGGWMLQSDRLEAVPLGETEHPPQFHTRGPNRIKEGPYGGSSGADRGGDDIPTGYNTFLNFESPRGDTINQTQIDTIVSWMDEFEDVLYGPDYRDPATGYRAYIDTQNFIDHLLLNNLPKNRDGLQLSTFIYRADENDTLHLGPIWDFDRAYNSNSFGGGATESLTWGQQFLWMPRLFEDPDFEQEYIDRYAELRETVFSNENMFAVIDAQVAEITAEVAQRDGNLNWSQDIQNMKNWLAQRVAALDALYLATPTFDSAGGNVEPGFELRITAPQGTVYYTTDGSDPRLPGGGIAPDATQLGLGASTPFVSAGDAAAAIVPDAAFDAEFGRTWTGAAANEPFDDSAAAGWISGTTGVGYDENPDYQPLIGLDLIDEMNDVNTSVFTRVEFDIVGAVPDLDLLTLRMQYDDGFIAYLNGVEIAAANAPVNPTWDSSSTGEQPDTSAQVFQAFDVSDFISELRSGTNVLAIQGLNRIITSSDMLIRPELSGGIFSDSTIIINRTSQVVARAFENGQWSGVRSALFEVDDPPPLRITEVHYNPAGIQDTEFIELQNVGPSPLEIGGYSLGFELNGVELTEFIPEYTLAPGAMVVLAGALSAFEANYPDVDSNIILGPIGFGLDNGGGRIQLLDDVGRTILDFEYDDADPWPQSSNGAGASLELIDPANTAVEDYGRSDRWRGSVDFGGSPGAVGPAPIGVVVNEILAHTDPPTTDSIELLNTTDATIDMGGWYLSDSPNNLLKYMIPLGTILAPKEYIVFDESHFNPTPLTPGPNDFALSSSNGDDVWLVVPDGNGGVAQFVDNVQFAATLNGQTLGRLPNGSGRLSPQGRNTLGCENGHFLSSPVVISEVAYNNPPSPGQIFLVPEITADDLEFIELHNASTIPVDLTDWQLGGGIHAEFAEGTTLAANEVAIVISFDPTLPSNADLLDAFNFGAQDVRILGYYDGQLGDEGDLVQLFRPDVPPADDPTNTPMVLADEVLYDNRSSWPIGIGASIHRTAPVFPGNEGANWVASYNPGIVPYDSLGATDFTGDDQFTAADLDLLLDHARNESHLVYLDQNGDRLVNDLDVEALLDAIWSTVPGDANLDGQVDAQDLNQVGIHWQENGCLSWFAGNFDGDNDVDVADLNVVGINWRSGMAAAAPRTPRAPLAIQVESKLAILDTVISETTTPDTGHERTAFSVRRFVDRHARRVAGRSAMMVSPGKIQHSSTDLVDELLANWRE